MTYKRFYKLFNRLPLHDDEMKERLVQQYTDGRTSSLRAMTAAEYDALCDALERSTADPQHELRKKKRSAYFMSRAGCVICIRICEFKLL